MAVAGYCDVCQRYVYLTEQWGCQNGHPWNVIRAWYDPETGQPVTPYWLQPGYAPAPAPEVVAAAVAPAPEPVAAAVAPAPEPVAPAPPAASRLDLLAQILETMAKYPGYNAHYGTDTDIVIDNNVADAAWPGGKKTVDYEAILKAVEGEHTVYFWEILKEKSAGLSFGTVEAEAYTTSGTKRSGVTKVMVLGTDGVPVEADWDFGATRQIIESVAAANGWSVKTVLKKGSAQW